MAWSKKSARYATNDSQRPIKLHPDENSKSWSKRLFLKLKNAAATSCGRQLEPSKPRQQQQQQQQRGKCSKGRDKLKELSNLSTCAALLLCHCLRRSFCLRCAALELVLDSPSAISAIYSFIYSETFDLCAKL